eukprot:Gb_19111 [translate_table: standard]
MVGIFGRFPGTKTSHPSQRSADENEKSVPSKEVVSSAHGVQLSSEFHPVEHPQEPPDKDRPVRCPQPEPCILHDVILSCEEICIKPKKEIKGSMKPKIDSSLFNSTKEDVRLTPLGFGRRTCMDGTKGPEIINFVKEPTMMHDFAITKNYVMVPNQQTMRLSINDKQYGALKNWGEQKQAFNEHLVHRKKQEVEGRHIRLKRVPKEIVKMLEECKELASTRRWSKTASLFENNKRLYVTEQGRESITMDKYEKFEKTLSRSSSILLSAPLSSPSPSISVHWSQRKIETLITPRKWPREKCLSSGTFGTIDEGFDRETSNIWAMKEAPFTPDDSQSCETIKQLEPEINLLSWMEETSSSTNISIQQIEDPRKVKQHNTVATLPNGTLPFSGDGSKQKIRVLNGIFSPQLNTYDCGSDTQLTYKSGIQPIMGRYPYLYLIHNAMFHTAAAALPSHRHHHDELQHRMLGAVRIGYWRDFPPICLGGMFGISVFMFCASLSPAQATFSSINQLNSDFKPLTSEDDGRIWKERLQASTQRSSELPVIREAGVQLQGSHRRRYTVSSERLIAPSFSAPEHAILKLLE